MTPYEMFLPSAAKSEFLNFLPAARCFMGRAQIYVKLGSNSPEAEWHMVVEQTTQFHNFLHFCVRQKWHFSAVKYIYDVYERWGHFCYILHIFHLRCKLLPSLTCISLSVSFSNYHNGLTVCARLGGLHLQIQIQIHSTHVLIIIISIATRGGTDCKNRCESLLSPSKL